MKKKLLLAVVCVLLAASFVVMTAGCTETEKQDAIATNYSDEISSNGGLAVVYGEYLYFINGYAGVDVDNTFGEVIKGSVMRVTLVDGKPSGTPVTIVPKNIYGTDTTYGGIYIVSDYIYYSTPSTEKDSSGAAKTAEMKLMRTKIDGSVTEEILGFDDYDVVFAVEGDNLMYVRENYLYSVDLTASKFEAFKVEEDTILTNYKMVDGYIIYCMYVDSDTSDYIMKVYPWKGGEPVVLMDAAQLRAVATASTTYTLSLLCAESDDTTFTVYYTKTDSELNTPEVGICSYTFTKANLAFDRTKEIRYTNNTADTTNLAFTNFYKVGNYVLALADTTIVFYNADGSFYRTLKKDSTELIVTSIVMSATTTIKKVFQEDSAVYMWYEISSVLYQIKLFDIDTAGNYTYAEANAQTIFSGTFDLTYCSYEVINGVVYYFNSGISNNIYYYEIPDAFTTDTDTATGVLLGVLTDADFIAAF